MSAAGNVKHQAAVADRQNAIDDLRLEAHQLLAEIRAVAELLDELASTRQSVGPGFVTEDARAARDKQARADREAARGGKPSKLAGETGLRWIRSTTVLGTGQVPAPVTVPAVSAAAEIQLALQHQVRKLARPAAIAAEAAGLCVVMPTSAATIAGTTERLDRLVDLYASRPGLQALNRELDHLEQLAREITDGPARSNYPDPCPWCDRNTLVAHHRAPGRAEMFIRCDGTHPCRCDDEWCPCQRNPVKNRHEWINSGRAKNPIDGRSRHSLTSLIAQRKDLAIQETAALEALERIRQLHTPSYDDGTLHFLWTEHPPTDHECIDDDEITGPSCRPEDAPYLHAVPACIECWTPEPDGGEDAIAEPVAFPCPTILAIDPPADEPAGDTAPQEKP